MDVVRCSWLQASAHAFVRASTFWFQFNTSMIAGDRILQFLCGSKELVRLTRMRQTEWVNATKKVAIIAAGACCMFYAVHTEIW